MTREQERLDRRRAIARNEARGFEDQLSALELLIVRLDALPEELREDNHDAIREKTLLDIERAKAMIAAMCAEGDDEPKPPNHQAQHPKR